MIEADISGVVRSTIAALATAPGQGGIGIIRLSGPAALRIAQTLSGRQARPRQAHYGAFRDAQGELIDQGILLYFPAPHSFTGEDVVELQAHGGPVVLNQLLDRCVELGACRAGPGEFSQRAFLNGKIDLAQAEAIADLIAAQSAAAARAAVRSLQGVFSRKVEQLVEALTRLRIHVEAAIDFPEEEIDFLADHAIEDQLESVRVALARLRVEARQGLKLRDGLHAVIVGPPNAGKSSLLNALAGDERAIVTDRAGTTRDVLRETVRIGAVELLLADTAGLRADSDDPIELEGMRRARQEQAQADLRILVVELGDEAAEQALAAEFPADRPRLWVHNKADLQGQPNCRRQLNGEIHLQLSVQDPDGLTLLKSALAECAQQLGAVGGGFSARQRHVDALDRGDEQLQLAAHHLATRMGELMAEDLRQAQHALGEITGAIDADALLGRIFSSFCIGK